MRIKQGLASTLDQAWLSVLSLAISFAFIRFATKEDYGTYLLLLTPLYLAMGIQNALVLSPITTVLPSSPEEDKGSVVSTANSSLFVFAVMASTMGGAVLILYWLATHNTIDVGLAFGFGVAIAGVCAREGSRTMFYVRGDATKALLADLTYGVGLIVVVGALSYRAQLTPTNVLLATGIAALWPYLLRWTAIKKLKIERKVLRQFWACGRWALVGVAVTWINLSAYPLIVGLTLDNAAVADINVARLFLMPVGLCITAWSNLNRPKISKWAATGHIEDIRKLSTRSIYFGVAAIALLSATTTSVYPLLEKLIGTTYTGLLPMVLLWSLFFVFNLIRSMLMATLLINADGYKQLQKISWLALTISLSGLWFLSPFGSIWAVGVLVVVELIQCILIGAKTLKWWSTSIKANEL